MSQKDFFTTASERSRESASEGSGGGGGGDGTTNLPQDPNLVFYRDAWPELYEQDRDWADIWDGKSDGSDKTGVCSCVCACVCVCVCARACVPD